MESQSTEADRPSDMRRRRMSFEIDNSFFASPQLPVARNLAPSPAAQKAATLEADPDFLCSTPSPASPPTVDSPNESRYIALRAPSDRQPLFTGDPEFAKFSPATGDIDGAEIQTKDAGALELSDEAIAMWQWAEGQGEGGGAGEAPVDGMEIDGEPIGDAALAINTYRHLQEQPDAFSSPLGRTHLDSPMREASAPLGGQRPSLRQLSSAPSSPELEIFVIKKNEGRDLREINGVPIEEQACIAGEQCLQVDGNDASLDGSPIQVGDTSLDSASSVADSVAAARTARPVAGMFFSPEPERGPPNAKGSAAGLAGPVRCAPVEQEIPPLPTSPQRLASLEPVPETATESIAESAPESVSCPLSPSQNGQPLHALSPRPTKHQMPVLDQMDQRQPTAPALEVSSTVCPASTLKEKTALNQPVNGTLPAVGASQCSHAFQTDVRSQTGVISDRTAITHQGVMLPPALPSRVGQTSNQLTAGMTIALPPAAGPSQSRATAAPLPSRAVGKLFVQPKATMNLNPAAGRQTMLAAQSRRQQQSYDPMRLQAVGGRKRTANFEREDSLFGFVEHPSMAGSVYGTPSAVGSLRGTPSIAGSYAPSSRASSVAPQSIDLTRDDSPSTAASIVRPPLRYGTSNGLPAYGSGPKSLIGTRGYSDTGTGLGGSANAFRHDTTVNRSGIHSFAPPTQSGASKPGGGDPFILRGRPNPNYTKRTNPLSVQGIRTSLGGHRGKVRSSLTVGMRGAGSSEAHRANLAEHGGEEEEEEDGQENEEEALDQLEDSPTIEREIAAPAGVQASSTRRRQPGYPGVLQDSDADELAASGTVDDGKHYGHVGDVRPGQLFEKRTTLGRFGVHKPHMAGIWSDGDSSVWSVVLSGGYNDDDYGEWMWYTGQGGRATAQDKKMGKEGFVEDQKRLTGNQAMINAVKTGRPVRVTRGGQANKAGGAWYPVAQKGMTTIYRYDGLYTVKKWIYEREPISGYRIYKFLLHRNADQSPLMPTPGMEHKAEQRRKVGLREAARALNDPSLLPPGETMEEGEGGEIEEQGQQMLQEEAGINGAALRGSATASTQGDYRQMMGISDLGAHFGYPTP